MVPMYNTQLDHPVPRELMTASVYKCCFQILSPNKTKTKLRNYVSSLYFHLVVELSKDNLSINLK